MRNLPSYRQSGSHTGVTTSAEVPVWAGKERRQAERKRVGDCGSFLSALPLFASCYVIDLVKTGKT